MHAHCMEGRRTPFPPAKPGTCERATRSYMRSSSAKSVGKKMSALPSGTRYDPWSRTCPSTCYGQALCMLSICRMQFMLTDGRTRHRR